MLDFYICVYVFLCDNNIAWKTFAIKDQTLSVYMWLFPWSITVGSIL